MNQSTAPANETLRLKALHELSVWERNGDQFYQDIANLACTLCDTKTSMISLVEHAKVRFFAKAGLELKEIPKDSSFCFYTIADNKTLIVNDTLEDQRFQRNPFVLGAPHVRFYAGAPLVTREGLKIGALCVLDTTPKDLSEAQVIALEALARQVVMRMEWERINCKLTSSVSHMQVLIDSMSAGILAEDSVGDVILANEQFFRLFPTVVAKEIVGESSLKIFKSMQHAFRNPEMTMARVTQIIERSDLVLGEEIELQDDRFLEIDHLPTLDESAQPSHLWIFRDVTYRRNLEMTLDKQKMQIVASAKLAALGEMAGGIAHEINNPLSIIQGRSQILSELARRDLLDKNAVVKAAQVINDTCARVAKIVRGLRTFAQDGERDPFETVQISTIVQDALGLCKERLQYSDVEISASCDPELTVTCRPVHIAQVLINLINNAFDAIKESSEKKWIHIEVVDLNDKYSVMVTDSGHGIPEDIQEKIMRPFFTTKEVGKGTGLGLSISRGIVESHYGEITIDSTCSNTRFVATLPKHPQRLGK